MRKNIIRAGMVAVFFLLFSAEQQVYAEENIVSADSGIAGITLMLKEYYNNVGAEKEFYLDGVLLEPVHRVPSPYENLGIANVSNYVNIRSGPSTEYEKVGKLYNGCVADILGWEGDWVRIRSGNLEEGYIKAQYLLIGWDAEEKIAEYCDKTATVNCSVLNVRTGMGTEYSIYEKLPRGETYYVAEEYEEWVKIILGQDDSTGRETTGYVYKEYVDIAYEFQYAVTLEEEKARLEAEAAAKKAEEERLKKLAQEEEARKKEILRNEIVSYAVQFVGNPYVWGGTSLTKGADCSGFVQSIYKQFGYTIPRVSKDQAVSAGYKDVIPEESYLLPGDLIFYTDEKGVVNHVALYIGDGMIVHAASKKKGIIIAKYTMRTPYKARRVIEE